MDKPIDSAATGIDVASVSRALAAAAASAWDAVGGDWLGRDAAKPDESDTNRPSVGNSPHSAAAWGDWRVVVNGQATLLPITPETRFDRIVKPALEATGNERWPESSWEIRDSRGRLLYSGNGLGFDTVGELQERGEIADEALWINLKPGVGA